jgi:CubicO group peptidase (beta-lactamase class C family)
MSHHAGPTRRSVLMAASGLIGLGSGLITSMSRAWAGVTFETYYGVSAAVHQAYFDRLVKRGFRPISLSVYGNPPNVQYSAVWVDRPGPGFAAVHNLNAQDYQAAFDNWTRKGYAPTLVAAAGAANNAIFAAVFEQGQQGGWRAQHHISEQEFNAAVRSATKEQLKLSCVNIYGTSNDPRYIAVWAANPGFAKWHALARVKADDYQRVFQAQTEIPQFRPASISIASDQSLCTVFTDESVGEWTARHGMTEAEYAVEFKRQRAAGLMPISVQGGGSGNGVRYAAIFAKQDQPLARKWIAAGQSDLGKFDDLMRAFMTKQAVRGAQLTIAQHGNIKLQRAYTWAEPGYREIAVSDRFLLASNSKMFVAAAVKKLYDQGRLEPKSRAYEVLGFKDPKDPRSDAITIGQLLYHNAGYTFDPTYDMRRIALARGLRGPAHMRDIAAYMYARDLNYPPGEAPDPKGWIYNNYDYLLASLVVEQVAGQDYVRFLREQVLRPDGITEVAVYPTAAASLPAGLVPIDDDGLGLSALAPHSNAQVPFVFGGDGMVKETAIGCCGLAASATALTQFIHRHAAWGIGGRSVSSRSGSTFGASTWAQSRKSGTDWALVMNTRKWVPGDRKAVSGLTDSINAELERQGL